MKQCYIWTDKLFFWDKEGNKGHCQLSYENELKRMQLPPEMRILK